MIWFIRVTCWGISPTFLIAQKPYKWRCHIFYSFILVSYWLWRYRSAGNARLIGSVQHCRSCHPAAAARSFVWYPRHITELVSVVPAPEIERPQRVVHLGDESTETYIQFGVPQGSVLGPLPFVLYTADVCRIVTQCGICVHQYTDNTQVYGSCTSHHSSTLCFQSSSCIEMLAAWMQSNRRQLNIDKTEFMWCISPWIPEVISSTLHRLFFYKTLKLLNYKNGEM